MPVTSQRDRSTASVPRRSRRDDSGATLILALVFLVVVSATVISLSSWAQGDLNSTRAFEGAQSFQSAANSATQVAIQYVRYNFLKESLNASPPTLCWASNGPATLTFNSETVDAWCSTRLILGSSKYRIVTISTCLNTVSRTACELAPLLQAIVKVSDTDQSGNWTCLPVAVGAVPPPANTDTCGQGMTIQSWAFLPSPPVVSSLNVSGGCSGSATASVNGSGFGNIVAVDAVSASGTSKNNLVYPASSYSSSGTSQITAVFPSMIAGSYYLRVSTSAGNSALVAASSFSC
jgi:hypothetical protein